MKKILAVLLAACMLLSLCSCGTITTTQTETQVKTNTQTITETKTVEPVEIIIFAAASMKETITKITEDYHALHPEVTFSVNFDSSGTLVKQIKEGADCDIFISAAQKQVNQIDKNDTTGANTDGTDLVLDGTRFNLLENKVALVVPEGNPANITSFEDMAAKLKEGTITFAMGGADVPVGAYTKKIFEYFGVDETAVESHITYGQNVKAVTTTVDEGNADCGCVYGSDAASAGLTVIAYATKEQTGGQVIYPACILNTSKHVEAAKAFNEYLKSDAAGKVFESVGLAPLN